MAADPGTGEGRQRIDKWLFFARIFKSRSIAQAHVVSGHVKVNGQVVRQSSRQLLVGDRIETSIGERDLVLIVRGAGSRRGPYEEARLLYEDQTPDVPRKRLTALEQALRAPGSGRPTKKDRRAIDDLLSGPESDI